MAGPLPDQEQGAGDAFSPRCSVPVFGLLPLRAHLERICERMGRGGGGTQAGDRDCGGRWSWEGAWTSALGTGAQGILDQFIGGSIESNTDLLTYRNKHRKAVPRAPGQVSSTVKLQNLASSA